MSVLRVLMAALLVLPLAAGISGCTAATGGSAGPVATSDSLASSTPEAEAEVQTTVDCYTVDLEALADIAGVAELVVSSAGASTSPVECAFAERPMSGSSTDYDQYVVRMTIWAEDTGTVADAVAAYVAERGDEYADQFGDVAGETGIRFVADQIQYNYANATVFLAGPAGGISRVDVQVQSTLAPSERLEPIMESVVGFIRDDVGTTVS